MEQQPKHTYIDLFFYASLIIKGVSAIVEIIAGFAAYFVTDKFVIHLGTVLTQDELSNDPDDTIANFLVHAAHQFSISDRGFIFFYLLSHGIIRLLLVIGLLKKKLWAYHVSFAVFGLFVIYQLYKYFHTRSPWLLLLTAFDIFFIWLVWKEYKFVKAREAAAELPA